MLKQIIIAIAIVTVTVTAGCVGGNNSSCPPPPSDDHCKRSEQYLVCGDKESAASFKHAWYQGAEAEARLCEAERK